MRTEDEIAIVTINGPLEHHFTFWWDSYEYIYERVISECFPMAEEGEEALAPARAIILKVDSPGGEAAGAGQLHRKLKKLRMATGIPFFTYSNECAASAAYELGCASDEIWLPREGQVGSIGVIATLFDRTVENARIGLGIELITSGKYKADGHPDRPISDGLRTRTQRKVDDLANHFFTLVAKARETTPKSIADLEAAVFYGQDAVSAGLADGVMDFDSFLSLVSRSVTQASAA